MFNFSFFRGWAAAFGLVPLHNLPEVITPNVSLLDEIEECGGFGFAVTRSVNPSFYQKQIDGVTKSPWGHCVMVIGEEIGKKVRLLNPNLMHSKPSHRWQNRDSSYPTPTIEGIRSIPTRAEIVESQAYVTVSDLTCSIGNDEQVIVFINPDWTLDQKLAMAVEAYSWVGEPYDVFEIGNWVSRLFPNPKNLKVCSSLVSQIIGIGDLTLASWANANKISCERFAPRDIFAYGDDMDYKCFCFNCQFEDALKCRRR